MENDPKNFPNPIHTPPLVQDNRFPAGGEIKIGDAVHFSDGTHPSIPARVEVIHAPGPTPALTLSVEIDGQMVTKTSVPYKPEAAKGMGWSRYPLTGVAETPESHKPEVTKEASAPKSDTSKGTPHSTK